MKKITILLILFLSFVQIYADNYEKLILETSEGNKSSITTIGTVITFTDGKLTAVNGEERQEIDLLSMHKMYFHPLPFILGDVNNDGALSLADITMIVNHILGLPNEGFLIERAFIDSDNEVSLTDVIALVTIILGEE